MTETSDFTTIPVAEVTGRSARVSIAIPDNQIRMPSSPYHAKPFDVRITSVTCIWEWSNNRYGGFRQKFTAGGYRTLKDGSDGAKAPVEFESKFEPPAWMSQIVGPHTPDWYQDGAAS